jgi:hypothetical protein
VIELMCETKSSQSTQVDFVAERLQPRIHPLGNLDDAARFDV